MKKVLILLSLLIMVFTSCDYLQGQGDQPVLLAKTVLTEKMVSHSMC